MGRKNQVFLLFLTILASVVSSTHGRKLLNVQHNTTRETLFLDESYYLNALPNGTMPPSTPSKNGNSETVDEKLVQCNLVAVDGILKSVPSPGVGH